MQTRPAPNGVPAIAAACALSLLLAVCALGAAGAQTPESGSQPIRHDNALPRSTPEAQGISSAAVLAFIDSVEVKVHVVHSFMLLRHGSVVAEGWWSPYVPGIPHHLHSLSKSFTSTAVGLAVAEGRLNLDDPVLSFFPDDAPADPSANLKAMRVRQLLIMSTGHAEDTIAEIFGNRDGHVARAILARPVAFAPGTHFLYNTGATYLLSAIVQKVTGMTVLDYLTPRLFEPLGIDRPTWGSSLDGVNWGGLGLSLKTEDLARFGQLLLQKGAWQGRQIVPSEWVAEATSRQTSNGSDPRNDWQQGYGYQFWRCQHGAYRGDGGAGQFCIVIPVQDAVVAITSGLTMSELSDVREMQMVLNLAWDQLLPAMQPAQLPEDKPLQERLGRRLASLSLALPQGRTSSPMARKVSGKVYVFPPNDQGLEAMSLLVAKDRCTLTLRDQAGDHAIVCGSGKWVQGILGGPWVASATMGNFYTGKPQLVSASGAWTADDTFVAKLCYLEASGGATLTLQFAPGQLSFVYEANIAMGPNPRPPLVGQVQ